MDGSSGAARILTEAASGGPFTFAAAGVGHLRNPVGGFACGCMRTGVRRATTTGGERPTKAGRDDQFAFCCTNSSRRYRIGMAKVIPDGLLRADSLLSLTNTMLMMPITSPRLVSNNGPPLLPG